MQSSQALARPPRRDRLPSPLAFLRAMQDNFISVWPEDAYARPVTHVRVGQRHMFTANTPALVRHVLLDNAANYQKTPIARRLLEPALGQGLVTAEGAVWKQHRQMMAPIFVQRRMAALVPAIVAETQAHLAGWPALAGQVFDVAEALSDITLRIITHTMFGAGSQAETLAIAGDIGHYQKLVRPSVLDFLGAPAWVPRPGTRAARRVGDRLTEAIHRIIARRRALADPPDDLLTRLLAAVDHDGVSLKEIRDEIATIFAAGHETTAASLAWTLYLLDRHPAVEVRLLEELRQVLGGRAPTAADLERLRYTRCVVEESLRLYPPAHTITRLALGPDRLDGVAVPAGAVVMVSPWLLHRNPTLWPEPERFDPDRFAAAPPERTSYIPFGTGPRICVGASFAMTETVAILATLLPRWRVRLAADQTVEPVALITMRPRGGLRVTAEPRGDAT